MYSLFASAVQILAAGGSITSPNSVVNKPFKYTHHQIVAGSIFDGVVSVALILWMVFVWYRFYGPGSKRAAGTARA